MSSFSNNTSQDGGVDEEIPIGTTVHLYSQSDKAQDQNPGEKIPVGQGRRVSLDIQEDRADETIDNAVNGARDKTSKTASKTNRGTKQPDHTKHKRTSTYGPQERTLGDELQTIAKLGLGALALAGTLYFSQPDQTTNTQTKPETVRHEKTSDEPRTRQGKTDNNHNTQTPSVQEMEDFNPADKYTKTDRGLPWTEDNTLEKQVERNVARLMKNHEDQLSATLSNISRFRSYIEENAHEYNHDADFLRSVIAVESRGNAEAESHAGAAGIAQFMEATAERYGLENGTYKDERLDPKAAIQASAQHLHKLKQRFNTKAQVLAAYNWGDGNLRRAMRQHGTTWSEYKDGLPPETLNYVLKATSREKVQDNSHELGFDYELQEDFATRRTNAITHTIQDDETLWEIAQEYNTQLSNVQSLNPSLKDEDLVAPGIDIYVPHSTSHTEHTGR